MPTRPTVLTAWYEPSSASRPDDVTEVFEVTHPFHPQCGQQVELLASRHNRGEHRVICRDARGRICSLPAGWTSVAPPDPYVVLSAGRSLFRPADLLILAARVGELLSSHACGMASIMSSSLSISDRETRAIVENLLGAGPECRIQALFRPGCSTPRFHSLGAGRQRQTVSCSESPPKRQALGLRHVSLAAGTLCSHASIG